MYLPMGSKEWGIRLMLTYLVFSRSFLFLFFCMKQNPNTFFSHPVSFSSVKSPISIWLYTFIKKLLKHQFIIMSYNKYKNNQTSIIKMQTTMAQVQNSSPTISLIYNLSFMNTYGLQYIFPTTFFAKTQYDNTPLSTNIFDEMNLNQGYRSQPKKNIVLNTKITLIHQKMKVSKITQSDNQTTKVSRKPTQKETRNINSNLMRIFLKNLIELKVYTPKINMISTRLGSIFTTQDFYKWIQKFEINFKNYIRVSQIKKIIGKDQPQHFKNVFLRLLQNYAQQIGLQHCLTSKRIERNSVKMHLEGLRSLVRELLRSTHTKN